MPIRPQSYFQIPQIYFLSAAIACVKYHNVLQARFTVNSLEELFDIANLLTITEYVKEIGLYS